MKIRFLIPLLISGITVVAQEKTPPPCCSEEAAILKASEVTKDSIYQLESEWTNQSGNPVKLISLGGKIQVITMGYSRCNYACPRLMADMKAIENDLPAEVLKDVTFHFFSIDATDTPELLKTFGARHKVEFDRWSFYKSNQATIQELAVVLGTNFRRTNDTDFAHSNLITVLNVKGEIIHRQEGLSTPAAPTVKAIVQASAKLAQ